MSDGSGGALELRARRDDQRQRGVDVMDGTQHAVGDGGILGHVRRECAVELDVVERPAKHAEHARKRSDLVDDVVEACSGVTSSRRAEADEVGQPRVCADCEPMLQREARGCEHGGRIAAVKPARKVDGGRVREGARVVPDAPRAVRLARVDVDVDDGHGRDLTRSHGASTGRARNVLLLCGSRAETAAP